MTDERPFSIEFSLRDMPYEDINGSVRWLDITVEIEGRRMTVGYELEEQEEQAQRFARQLVYAWALRNRTPVKPVEVTRKSWTADGKSLSTAELTGEVRFSGRLVATHTRMAEAGAVLSTEIDTGSFVTDADTARKALAHYPLSEALRYYSEEGAGNERPLYGIYKALEVLCHDLGQGNMEAGKTALAGLVVQSKDYVTDVMQTTQLQRHAVTAARQKLSEAECRERAASIIAAYAENQ